VFTAFAFNSAWEWSTGVGTVDATMTNIVSVGASGGGPSGLNAHASTTAFVQPFDQGTGTGTVSITGTTPFAFTSSAGEIFGLSTYDDTNPLGGTQRLVFLNVWGLMTPSGTPTCSRRDPNFVQLATGGPGGPALTTLIPQEPRVVGKIDLATIALLSNPLWLAATIHATVPGGNNIPWFPAAAGQPSGSTGNTGGFALPIPQLAQLIGLQCFLSSVTLNAGGNAIAKFLNNGHSHSNGYSFLMFP
jgi:hypothetical protein